jgi:2-polyprenyl-3-methyl-5-hydroxy-6-metoxy-1,4-benzoquinol methylase
VVYEGPIRAGTAGTETDRSVAVRRCSSCGVQFLDPPTPLDYETSAYRESYNASGEIADYFRTHDAHQVRYLAALASRVTFRGRVVADFGAGAGAFLDLLAGIAEARIAVEPYTTFRQSLQERGYRSYRCVRELLDDRQAPRVEVGVSFHVIEHVPDPVAYLREIRDSMAGDGVLHVLTPNADDLLMRLDHDPYRRFNYRTAHLWYFTAPALRWCAEAAGFRDVHLWYEHNYDLSNFTCWLKEGRPTGVGRIPLFDARVNASWKSFLESAGLSSELWMQVTP